VKDLGLSDEEQLIFIRMMGFRYNTGRKEARLTTDRFPNRIENKRYLIYLLENLVAEAKLLLTLIDTVSDAPKPPKYIDPSWKTPDMLGFKP
jgi:hypothetical protein